MSVRPNIYMLESKRRTLFGCSKAPCSPHFSPLHDACRMSSGQERSCVCQRCAPGNTCSLTTPHRCMRRNRPDVGVLCATLSVLLTAAHGRADYFRGEPRDAAADRWPHDRQQLRGSGSQYRFERVGRLGLTRDPSACVETACPSLDVAQHSSDPNGASAHLHRLRDDVLAESKLGQRCSTEWNHGPASRALDPDVPRNSVALDRQNYKSS